MAGSSSRWSEVVLALGSNLVGIHRVTGRGQGRHTLGAQCLPWGKPLLLPYNSETLTTPNREIEGGTYGRRFKA